MKDSLEKQQRYYALGEKHFWLASHYDIVMACTEPLLKKARVPGKDLKILDAGCGPGNLVARLLPWGEVVGIDASLDAISFCKQKHDIKVHQIKTDFLPFADNTFDFIFALEVIEHIENDLFAMEELYRILKPNGLLIATVPAFMFLWGYHDDFYGHYRRYTKARFIQLALSSGFLIERSRYFKVLPFIPLIILRLLKKATHKREDDFYEINPTFSFILRKIINSETPLVTAIPIPFGCSIISILRKTTKSSGFI